MIELEGVSKTYRKRGVEVRAVDSVDLSLEPGSFTLLRGPSGCGKTTMLMVIGGMLTPNAGRVTVKGVEPYGLSSSDRCAFRTNHVGFIFQLFHLLPYLTAWQNVTLASRLGGTEARRRAGELLERFDLSDRMHHRPEELSAGERQRVAVARALVNDPAILLADEPTGSLDPAASEAVRRCLCGFVEEGGTVVMATHAEPNLGDRARTVWLERGAVASPPATLAV